MFCILFTVAVPYYEFGKWIRKLLEAQSALGLFGKMQPDAHKSFFSACRATKLQVYSKLEINWICKPIVCVLRGNEHKRKNLLLVKQSGKY